MGLEVLEVGGPTGLVVAVGVVGPFLLPPPPPPPASPSPPTLATPPPHAKMRPSPQKVMRAKRRGAREVLPNMQSRIATFVPSEEPAFSLGSLRLRARKACQHVPKVGTLFRVFALVPLLVFGACHEDSARPPPTDVALAGLSTNSPIPFTFETTEGTLHCAVEPQKAPRAVAMFVGLARGLAPWRDPKTGTVRKQPFYAGLDVFRATEGSLLQSGCPLGDGTGTPGYRIPVEPSADDRQRLARPGALLLARYHAPPNRPDPHPPPPGDVIGSQFVITLNDMSHLAGDITVIGTCRDLDVAGRIASVVAHKERTVKVQRVDF